MGKNSIPRDTYILSPTMRAAGRGGCNDSPDQQSSVPREVSCVCRYICTYLRKGCGTGYKVA